MVNNHQPRVPHSHLFQDPTPEEEEEFARLTQLTGAHPGNYQLDAERSLPPGKPFGIDHAPAPDVKATMAGYIHDGQLRIELFAPLTDDAREYAIHFLMHCP